MKLSRLDLSDIDGGLDGRMCYAVVKTRAYRPEHRSLDALCKTIGVSKSSIYSAIWRHQGRVNNQRHASVIYLIRAGEYYKIGHTTNLARRFVAIKTACPFEPRLILHFPGSHKLERRIHKMFADRHCHGEWFSLSGEDVGWFKTAAINRGGVVCKVDTKELLDFAFELLQIQVVK